MFQHRLDSTITGALRQFSVSCRMMTSASSLAWLLWPLLAAVALGLGLLLWAGRWLLRSGPDVGRAAAAWLGALRDAALRRPAVQALVARRGQGRGA